MHLEVERGLVVLAMWIEGQQVVLRGPAQGLRVGGGLRHQSQTCRERCRDDPCVAFHEFLLESIVLQASACHCGALEVAVWYAWRPDLANNGARFAPTFRRRFPSAVRFA